MKRADNPVHVFETFMLSSERRSTRRTLVDLKDGDGQFPQLDFSSLFVSALSLATATWVVPTTHVQVDRAELNGTVTDTSGKALSAVQITALETATGLHRETLTSSTGTYDIPENSVLSQNSPWVVDAPLQDKAIPIAAFSAGLPSQ
jgi:hypothetical protein